MAAARMAMADDPTLSSDLGMDEPEPLLEELLQDALAPYLNVLSPEQVADYRALLTVFLTTHPSAAPRYQHLRRRGVTGTSAGVPHEPPDRRAQERLDGTSNGRKR